MLRLVDIWSVSGGIILRSFLACLLLIWGKGIWWTKLLRPGQRFEDGAKARVEEPLKTAIEAAIARRRARFSFIILIVQLNVSLMDGIDRSRRSDARRLKIW